MASRVVGFSLLATNAFMVLRAAFTAFLLNLHTILQDVKLIEAYYCLKNTMTRKIHLLCPLQLTKPCALYQQEISKIFYILFCIWKLYLYGCHMDNMQLQHLYQVLGCKILRSSILDKVVETIPIYFCLLK